MAYLTTNFFEGGTAEQYRVVLGAAHPTASFLPARSTISRVPPRVGGSLLRYGTRKDRTITSCPRSSCRRSAKCPVDSPEFLSDATWTTWTSLPPRCNEARLDSPKFCRRQRPDVTSLQPHIGAFRSPGVIVLFSAARCLTLPNL